MLVNYYCSVKMHLITNLIVCTATWASSYSKSSSFFTSNKQETANLT